jgi:hypothetical protein
MAARPPWKMSRHARPDSLSRNCSQSLVSRSEFEKEEMSEYISSFDLESHPKSNKLGQVTVDQLRMWLGDGRNRKKAQDKTKKQS